MEMDVQKIRGKMAEKNYNITSLSAALGVSRNTLSGYFDTPEKMPYSIVGKIAELLCDSRAEAMSIFFASNLRAT